VIIVFMVSYSPFVFEVTRGTDKPLKAE